MPFTSNNLYFFLNSQQTKRKTLSFFTNSWLLTLKDLPYNYKDMSHSYLSFFLRVYIKNLQKKEINSKKHYTLLADFREKNFFFNLLNVYKNQKNSWGVLFVYSSFFWNLSFNNPNDIFKKKIRSIGNNYNSVETSTKQNQPSINRRFVDTYKTLKKPMTFRFAQPVMGYLMQQPKKVVNIQQRNHKKKQAFKVIMHFIFGNYLYHLNSANKAISWKGADVKFNVVKTSKIVYAANQFALNTLLKH